MARSLTLTQIKTRCQQRADREQSDHVGGLDTTEWESLISEAYGEMYMLVAEAGSRYFETEATIAITGATSYALPAAHLATLAVDRVTSSAGERESLFEVMPQERAAVIGRVGQAEAFGLVGSNLELYPAPTTGDYRHIYIPQPTDLSSSAGSTSVDLINVHGQAYVIWSVKLKALDKSESDVRVSMNQIAKAEEGLRQWALIRSFNTPRRQLPMGGDHDRLPMRRNWP